MWVDVSLTWEESDRVIDDPPLALAPFLNAHAGQSARLRLTRGGPQVTPLIAAEWVLVTSKQPVDDALAVLLHSYDVLRSTIGVTVTPEQADATAALRELVAA